MNAKQRRTFRRAVTRYLDAFVADCYGESPEPPRLAPRFRRSDAFWVAVEKGESAIRSCEYDDDPYPDEDGWDDDGEWDDPLDRDEDDDERGCWESGKFRRGFCPDDLCHGANRCMAKPRPWEDEAPR